MREGLGVLQAIEGALLQLYVRPAAAGESTDRAAIWTALEPVLRAGETLALPRDWSRNSALAYWFSPGHEVFVAVDDANTVVGTYYLRANQQGGGAHVANAAYVTMPKLGGRGVARMMCEHSIQRARQRGFRGMQFNFVVSTNAPAVHLWESMHFEIVGRLPQAFSHPQRGYVDVFVMYRPV